MLLLEQQKQNSENALFPKWKWVQEGKYVAMLFNFLNIWKCDILYTALGSGYDHLRSKIYTLNQLSRLWSLIAYAQNHSLNTCACLSSRLETSYSVRFICDPYLCLQAARLWLSYESLLLIYEPRHEISNNLVCATSKDSDKPVHTRRLIRTFASCLNVLWVLSYWQNKIWGF